MKAIKPYANIVDIGESGDVLKKIEWIGRTCYKSTENIKEGSAEKFVLGLVKAGHEAMVEHATFIFKMDARAYNNLNRIMRSLSYVGFKSFLRTTYADCPIISGNVRAWRDFAKECLKELGAIPKFMEDFIFSNPILFPEYLNVSMYDHILDGKMTQITVKDLVTENEKLTHWDVTVQWVVDRGITHEIVRHRPASFAQESTRYCNYSKDKFGNELTFIIPEFFEKGTNDYILWKAQMELDETAYMKMINRGVTPEKARTILPHSLKTELIMTAPLGEWKHFFALRACNVTGKAHPQMLEVAVPLMEEFKKNITGIFDDLK